MARTVFGDHKRYVETYFSTYPGKLNDLGDDKYIINIEKIVRLLFYW